MASKILTILEDDLDGGTAEETVRFSLDGVSYEIDLSAKNAARLRTALAPFVGNGRRVGGRAARGTGGAKSANGNRTPEIRAWARKQNIEVNDRGRIPADIVARFHKANK
ncbi:MAG: histone-like nucleoid-structuring protein Lsr2 [Sporichthyaceae bacterium]